MITRVQLPFPFQRGMAMAKPAIEFTIRPKITVSEVTRTELKMKRPTGARSTGSFIVIYGDISDRQKGPKRGGISQKLLIWFQR